MMERPMPKAINDSASYGAEALPAGFREMSDVMRSQSPASQGGAGEQPGAPLLGLIALAAHWMKKRA
jgi:hypothetical protein